MAVANSQTRVAGKVWVVRNVFRFRQEAGSFSISCREGLAPIMQARSLDHMHVGRA